MSIESLNHQTENNWSMLVRERLMSPDTKHKFFELKRRFPTIETRTRDEYINQFSSGKPTRPKADIFKDEYESLLTEENYEANLEKVFDSTDYINAHEAGKEVTELGSSDGRGDVGSVFKDAQNYSGSTLGVGQKGIVEAHEKMHGIVEPLTLGEADYILSCFKTPKGGSCEILRGYDEEKQAIELLIRMSQLKNYLGFRGEEEFTREHLDFVREHYIKDTGLDNNMSDFFDAIDRENEGRFIELMNTVAC